MFRKNAPTFFMALIASFLMTAALSLTVYGQPLSTRTVRVGYPIQAGLTDKDADGNYYGYTYEYLEEIAQYTGWDYEFVEVAGDSDESLLRLLDMLRNGEIDLMGGMLYTQNMASQFDYSSHSYGVSETVLQVPIDSSQDFVINSLVPQTYRIAVLSQGAVRMKELQDYCAMNLITPEYVMCRNKAEQLDALKSGHADMILSSSMIHQEGLRTIAHFAFKPFYFITTKGQNPELMDELNSALLNIDQANPYFSTTLYETYFSPHEKTLRFSEGELEYIRTSKVLNVGVLTSQPPYQYYSETKGELSGISVQLLNYVSDKSGLEFQLIPANSPKELYRLAQDGEIQMVAGMPYNYDLARKQNISMTRPYLTATHILLSLEPESQACLDQKTIAVSWPFNQQEFTESVSYLSTSEECLRAVLKGQADFTCVDAYTAQYYVNIPAYHNFKLIPQNDDLLKFSFGVVKSEDMELLSILNKVIYALPPADLQTIIGRNTVVQRPLSAVDLIRENPMESVIVTVFTALTVIAVLLNALRLRARANRRNALELKKHFRVYALVNEYFFEYNLATGLLLVNIPSKDSENFELREYTRADLKDDPSGQAFIRTLLSGDGIKEVVIPCIDGQPHWLRLAVETIYDRSTPAYVIGKLNRIDEEKRLQDELVKEASLDSLTQLYNTGACRSLVSEALKKLPDGQRGALLLIDVDHFKEINDTYGHLRGDEALRMVAKLLQTNFRTGDIIGRPGGDEFLVFMPSVPDRRSLTAKCQTVCEQASRLPLTADCPITVSAGAAFAARGCDYDDLYEAADQALYEAKNSGRNRYWIANGDRGPMSETDERNDGSAGAEAKQSDI